MENRPNGDRCGDLEQFLEHFYVKDRQIQFEFEGVVSGSKWEGGGKGVIPGSIVCDAFHVVYNKSLPRRTSRVSHNLSEIENKV